MNPEQPLIDAVTQIRSMIHLPEKIEKILDDAMAKCPDLVIAGYEGCAGLYYTRQLAVANGEQKIEPVYRVKVMKWTPWPLLMILLAFMLGYGLGSLGSKTPVRPVSKNEWRQAPHEQQPEPMMAQALGVAERWLL